MHMTTTQEINIEFLFDFASPNAYMCHKLIPAIEARTGVRIVYKPILLGGLFKLANNRPPFESLIDVPNKMAYERLDMQRFLTRHELAAFTFNPHFPVSTLPLMRGAIAAQQLGCFEHYVDTVFAAMWERGLKMDDLATIGKVLSEAGLDAEQLVKTGQDAGVKAMLQENTHAAHATGAFGIPTFLLGGELYFGKDRLRELEEKIMDMQRAAAPVTPA